MANNKPPHRPRKRFGQHFLNDPHVLERIAGQVSLGSTPNVLEIGPGMGALTDYLLEKCKRLTVVELDRDLAERLRRRYANQEVQVVEMDVLRFQLASLPPSEHGEKFQVFGNLPYNISTPLLFHLLNQISFIEKMVFMVQKEVALRLTAVPGHKNYGRLTVMTALDLHTEVLFDVPPSAFDPPPRVDSSVVRLIPRSHHEDFDRNTLSKVVAAAFSQRRKTLRNALGKIATVEQLSAANIDPGQRAENIHPEEFVRLSKVIAADAKAPA